MNEFDDERPRGEEEDDNQEVYFEDIEEEFEEKEMVEKKTVPIMCEYEKTNIITKRKQQLDNGSLSTLSETTLQTLTSSYDIAMLEFENGTIPYVLKRTIDGGLYELWRHGDFEFFPS